jgi:hypothetical protein
MLPTSKTRLYANVNANINEILTKEKAISMSKSMSKFYKKPKPESVAEPKYYIEETQNSFKQQEPLKKEKEQEQKDEQANYIGEKEDLNNLDFLFRS